MRKDFHADLAELKEHGDEHGDLERKRAKSKNKDIALDMLDRIGGLKE